MIRQVRGRVEAIGPDGAVIDVSGWGVFVHMCDPSSLSLGSEAVIDTYMHVKQDGIDLYGFTNAGDKRFFELSLGVSGVGPKTALSLLKRSPREALEQAIGSRDISYLTRVVGLGKKAAEKLAVELSEKMAVAGDEYRGDDADVFDTLVALGYTEREARKAVGLIPAGIEGKDARLKAALSAKA